MNSIRPAESTDVAVVKARQVADVLLYESFGLGDLAQVRARCYECALGAGLVHERALMFASSINEAMLAAVRQGGGHGVILLRQDSAQRLIAEILDARPDTLASLQQLVPPAEVTRAADGQ